MISLATNRRGLNKVVQARVIPVEGKADEIKKLYSSLINSQNDYIICSESHSVLHLVKSSQESFDPAMRCSYQFTGFIESAPKRSPYVKMAGKEALYTDSYMISKYAASIRLLFEALYGPDVLNGHYLSDMIKDEQKFEILGSNSEELGDLDGWYNLCYYNCPDFKLFCDEVSGLITFEQDNSVEVETFKMPKYEQFLYLPPKTRDGQNNMAVLKLAKKVPGFMLSGK